MSEFCHVVPWYNSEEWLKVYEEIFNVSSCNKESALKDLLVWKVRCPFLPSGIESTLSLLQVHVEDTKQGENYSDDRLLRLAYSSAIMRFVNHMLDTETVKGSSLYQAAKHLRVPDWIIDLRHDTAHSNNLPQITLLREACAISLQWLQENYWDKFKPNIKDYVSGEKHTANINNNKINALISLCTSLSICAHSNCKIKNLSDIPNMDMRESIINDIKDLFEDHVDLTNLKTVSIKSLIHLMNKQNKLPLHDPEVISCVNETILGEDSLFLSRELLYFFSAHDFNHKNRLRNNYMQCFEVLLNFLHTNNLLLEFLMNLIKITQDSESQQFKARLAALWVSEILAALKRTQEFSRKLSKLPAETKQTKNKKDLKHLYNTWFPGSKGDNLMLDHEKPIPRDLLDITYIQPIIAAYNPYLVYFIRNLLNLLDPPLPSTVSEKVYKLAELISSPEKFILTTSTTYTVDDLLTNDDDVVITEVILPGEVTTHEQEKPVNSGNHGIWQIASKDHDWSSAPIGLLPWQIQINNVTMETNHD